MVRKTLCVVALLACLLPSAAAVSDVPAVRPLSDKEKRKMQAEEKQGAEIAAKIAKGVKFSTDKAMVDRVTRIGERIAAVANAVPVHADKANTFGSERVYPFKWTFNVIQDPDINAFSIEGGHVYVYSGLIRLIGSDDELAAVIGHEITHAAHHHMVAEQHEETKLDLKLAVAMIAAAFAHASTEDLGNVFAGASYAELAILNNTYSEAAERDADYCGLIYMQKAGFDPVAMLTVQEKLWAVERQSPVVVQGTIFQDHPGTEERVHAVEAHLSALGITPNGDQLSRLASNADHFTAVAGDAGTSSITFNKRVCVVLHDPDGSRSGALLPGINKSLDDGLKFGDVTVSNATVMLHDHPWLTVLPADISPGSPDTPATLAQSVAHNIQVALYGRTFIPIDTSPRPVIKPAQ